MSQSLTPIRKYFTERLLEIDKAFTPHSKVNDDSISRPRYNKSFHIKMGALTGGPVGQNATRDSIEVTVSLHFKGEKDPLIASDKYYEVANKFRLNCMKPEHIVLQEFITRVKGTSVTPIESASNQTNIEFEIKFDVEMVFPFEDSNDTSQ